MTEQPGAPLKFAADAMLGSLARWMRLLGYDCTYVHGIADEALVAQAGADGRTLLTRDREVALDAAHAVFVNSHDLEEQLMEVVVALRLPLPEEPATSRCSICNGELQPVSKAQAEAGKVPEGALLKNDEFWRCPGCNRFYWKGTHFTSMSSRLRELRTRLAQGPK